MRTSLNTLALASVLVFATVSDARADWQLAPFLGVTFKGETTLLDPEQAVAKVHWTYGVSIALMGRGPVGVEGIVTYTPGFFQQDNPPVIDGLPTPDIVSSRTLGMMGNVVLTIPRSWNEYGLRPYVSGGLGLLHASSKDSLDLQPVSTNLLGYNVGGGAVGFLSERTGLRFDFRYVGTVKKIDNPEIAIGLVQLSYWTGSVGVVFRF